MLKKQSWKLFSLLTSIAFFIRALVFICYLGNENRYWQVDSVTYHRVATSLATGKGLTNPDGTLHFYRVPGYPYFLSLFYRIFGIEHKNGIWPQIIIASFIPGLISLLSLTLFPYAPLVATVAGFWAVFHLGFILYAGFFMTESLFLFFLLLFFLFFFPVLLPQNEKENSPIFSISAFSYSFDPMPEALGTYYFIHNKEDTHIGAQTYSSHLWNSHEQAIINSLWAGIFLGITALIRPVGHYLLVVSLLTLLFTRSSWHQKIGCSFALTLGWLFSASWWLIRNYALLGHLFFHTLPGGHFLYLSAARVAMAKYNCSYQEARKRLHIQADTLMDKKKLELGRPLSPIEACLINENLAKKYFFEYPLVSLKLWATDIFRTMFSLYSAEILYLENNREETAYFDKEHGLYRMIMRYLIPNTNSWKLRLLVYAEIFLFLILLLGFAKALLLSLFNTQLINLRTAFLSSLPFMALFIIISLAGGYARMRLPVVPFLIIFSSYWWTRCLKRKI